ncbi:hypothetical protein PSHT_05510 [Puccinia striiformis]|uniref:Uncharacterized protein n=1 Tax=Puccinia striiformis TaxID=27350 RepID=A0A2S4WAF0_9BASI|nr:hypothetical protein PSHT_05510 [Puccinia striiformis]
MQEAVAMNMVSTNLERMILTKNLSTDELDGGKCGRLKSRRDSTSQVFIYNSSRSLTQAHAGWGDGGTGHSHTDVLVLTRTPAGGETRGCLSYADKDHDHHHQKPPSSSYSIDWSCSPIAPTFDVKSRCLQIDRRFSSPSTSITTARRDSRIDSHFNTRIDKEKDRMNGIPSTKMLPSINLSVLQSHFMMPNRPRDFRIFDPGPFFHLNNNDERVIEIGCLILFHHQYVAFNFERVLNLNSPFLPVQTRLVDPAQIQFLPSATTINNPPKQQQQQQAYLNLLR